MIPTVFGALIIGLGLWFLTKPVAWTFALMIVCTEFGAASAINLPALGGSTVTPAHLALGFVILRLLIDRKTDLRAWLAAGEENLFLVGFAAYSAVTAFILPRLFQGQILVVPLRDTVNGLVLGPAALKFTPQNITTAVYLIGTAAAAISGGLVSRRREATMAIVSSLIVVGWLHAGFGVADLLLTAIHRQDWLDLFRNGSYAQLDQEVGGFRRIAGVQAETSAYASYGLVFFVFASELCLRGMLVRRAAPLAIVLLTLLALTTSTSAYIGLAAYALLIAARLVFVPGGSRPAFTLSVAAVALVVLMVVLGISALDSHLAERLASVVADMTVNKHNSSSGRQRAELAQQGLAALNMTHGLGIGAGSFRSSSLVTAVLGSAGLIGAAFLTIYIAQLAKPLNRSSYGADVDGRRGVGAAAGWAALVSLAPLAFIAASPDPGLLFGLLAGLGLGWRGDPARAPQDAAPVLRLRERGASGAQPRGIS